MKLLLGQSGACVGWLLAVAIRPGSWPGRPAPACAGAGVQPVLLEAAGCTQRSLRVHESESGVEIEPAGIIDRMRPDVASEMARLPF